MWESWNRIMRRKIRIMCLGLLSGSVADGVIHDHLCIELSTQSMVKPCSHGAQERWHPQVLHGLQATEFRNQGTTFPLPRIDDLLDQLGRRQFTRPRVWLLAISCEPLIKGEDRICDPSGISCHAFRLDKCPFCVPAPHAACKY